MGGAEWRLSPRSLAVVDGRARRGRDLGVPIPSASRGRGGAGGSGGALLWALCVPVLCLVFGKVRVHLCLTAHGAHCQDEPAAQRLRPPCALAGGWPGSPRRASHLLHFRGGSLSPPPAPLSHLQSWAQAECS